MNSVKAPKTTDQTEQHEMTLQFNEQDNLNILHQNIQCLRNKTLDLELYINTMNVIPDILCLTEHWLVEDEVEFVKLQNYRMVSCFARQKSIHGGSCIFLKDDKQDFQELNCAKEKSIEGEIEISCIISKIRKIIILSVYRTCLGNFSIFLNVIEDALNEINRKFVNFKIVICGDFNVNFMVESNDKKSFLELLEGFNLHQTIFDPTRVTKTTQTLIDNIFINSREFESSSVEISGLSDHFAQLIIVKGKRVNKNPITTKKRIFSRSKIQQFILAIQKCDWSDVLGETDVDKSYYSFLKTFKSNMNIIFPEKKVTSKCSTKTWITKGIKKSCRRKRELYKDVIAGRISENFYKSYSKILKQVIRQAKIMDQTAYIKNSENKTKATWYLVKNITNNDKCANSSIFDSFPNKKEVDLLNEINNFFVNACPDITQNKQADFSKIKVSKQSLFLNPVTEHEVYTYIMNLKNKKSMGCDEIPVSLLKPVAGRVAIPLTHIINLSLSTGTYPNALKEALVKPVHKKGEKDKLDNYRPISLLSNINKVFERVIYDRLVAFLERRNIIAEQQNGFRRGKSTITAIYQALEKILDSLNKQEVTAALCLDLSKAFDSVEHTILLGKMEMSGVRGVALQLFKSYLSNRKQRIIETGANGDRVTSECRYISRGVPQGSILGPLLYIIYSNDLANIIENKIVLFADDTSVICTAKTKEECSNDVTNVLDGLNEWFSRNNLMLNVTKTKLIEFRRNQEHMNINYMNTVIESVENLSFLGLQIDQQLNWKAHIHGLTQKIARSCYALRIIVDAVGVDAALSAYHAFVQARVRYGIIFWGNSVETNRVFILQKKCLRVIFKLKQAETCKKVFIDNNILTLYSMYIYESVMLVINNPSLFTEMEYRHVYNTRNMNDLRMDRARFTYIQKNVSYNVVSIWNKLPQSFKNKPKSMQKIQLKHFLSKKCYYNSKEFFEEKDFNHLT